MSTPETQVVAEIDNDNIYYYIKPTEKQAKSWEDLPPDIKQTWDRLGIPEAERKFLAGVGAQYESEVVYHKLKDDLEPQGVIFEMPLQAYFRINAENMGQFERTLIIVDEGAYVHYVEGCTAPIYTTDSLHSAVVEIIVNKDARCRYTTIQNWSTNVYNLVTKRAVAYEGATMEWVDGNLGSKLTMKYPSICMLGDGANCEELSSPLDVNG